MAHDGYDSAVFEQYTDAEPDDMEERYLRSLAEEPAPPAPGLTAEELAAKLAAAGYDSIPF